jgi:glycosyltransferase involved in cell wall biosynthesis
VPLQIDGAGGYYFPEFIGRYVDALALNVSSLILIAHSEQREGEYKLKSNNIELIDLGLIKSAWYRHFFHKKILKNVLSELDVDIIIVRSPTPLSLFISRYINKEINILYYVVGSYQSGAKEMKILHIRDIFIKMYLHWYTINFNRVIRKGKVVVNSPQLIEEFPSQIGVAEVIPSSILLSSDFYQRTDTCQTEIKKLLYVGRLESQKGIKELLLAFSNLSKSHVKYELHIVGEINSYSKLLLENLNKEMFPTKVMDNIFFHGFKKNGPDLNYFYRNTDIFILPSYHEGLPRVILEAMANSLPVIATSVGSIPIVFQNRKNIILIPPKSESDISNAVEVLVFSETLRKKMIIAGEIIAKQYTLDDSIKKMVNTLNSLSLVCAE